jgi:uncharacterized iron-regulated membrane protein
MAPPSPAAGRPSKLLPWSRKIHSKIAALLFAFFFVVSGTGLMLGWKKNTGGYLLAKSHQGVATDLRDWLSVDSLASLAVAALRDSVSADLSPKLDRIDARPDKGMVKIHFAGHYWAVQLDAATGEVLHVERRRADFIENIHDGSIVDKLLGTGGQPFKLAYTTVMGASLFFLTLTGFWMWYAPKRMRRRKKAEAAPTTPKPNPS